MSITTDELNKQCELISKLRVEEAIISGQRKEVLEKLDEAERRMVEMLAESGITSYKSPFGSAVLAHRTSVKIPRTPDDREKFFAFLKSRGLFETMISVNSNTLNSFYKSELELAKERKDPDFAIPGIEGVTITPVLRFGK
jgi:hypothetical protein